MPEHIPISAAEQINKQYGGQQTILVVWDGERTHVVTHGITETACAQAAVGGNMVKKALGWPDSLISEIPERAKTKIHSSEISALVQQLMQDAEYHDDLELAFSEKVHEFLKGCGIKVTGF